MEITRRRFVGWLVGLVAAPAAVLFNRPKLWGATYKPGPTFIHHKYLTDPTDWFLTEERAKIYYDDCAGHPEPLATTLPELLDTRYRKIFINQDIPDLMRF